MTDKSLELPHLLKDPVIPDSCYVDPTARINGAVVLGEDCSVWFHASIRGDVHDIRLGHRTNVQDNCILHTSFQQWPLTVGDDVTYGHGAVTHGCTIGNRVLIGMQALIMDGAVIGDDVLIAAGAMVTEGKQIPPGVLVVGRPAKVLRDLTADEIRMIHERSHHYVAYAAAYRRAGKWHGWGTHPLRGK